jgi:addiction module RelB/DinJ family antitoxin
MKTSLVRARIDEDLKEQATDVLEQNGLEMSDAIRLFLIQVVRKGGLPFSVRSKRAVPGGRRRPSRLANELDLDLLNEHRALSPTERLNVFLAHSRQMAQLQAAGEALRPGPA